ncbi:MAG: FlgO family outer membrane protein [Planctomycetota bacterium]
MKHQEAMQMSRQNCAVKGMLCGAIAVCVTWLAPSAIFARPSPPSVAVLPFVNQRTFSPPDWIGNSAPRLLTEKLRLPPTLYAVPYPHVLYVVEEQKLNLSRETDVLKAGKALGVDRVVVGFYERTRDSIHFHIRVLDVRTGVVVGASGISCPHDQLPRALWRLAETVVQSFDKTVSEGEGRPVACPAASGLALTPDQKNQLRDRATPHPEAVVYLGLGYMPGDAQERIRWFSRALDASPDCVLAYVGRAQVYGDTGQLDQAIADCDRAISIDASYAPAYHLRGLLHRQNRDNEKAIREFASAIDADPYCAPAYMDRADVYFKEQQFAKALADYSRVIDLNPGSDTAYEARGKVYFKQGDFRRAIEDFDRTIELDPCNAKTYCSRGMVYGAMNDYCRAIEDFSKSIECDPKIAWAYALRGGAKLAMGNFRQGFFDFAAASKLDPKCEYAYHGRGVCHYFMEEYEKAVADFDKVLELNPNNSVAYACLVCALYKQTDYVRAARLIEEARSKGIDLGLNPRFMKYVTRIKKHFVDDKNLPADDFSETLRGRHFTRRLDFKTIDPDGAH